jgi:hypothetical protein
MRVGPRQSNIKQARALLLPDFAALTIEDAGVKPAI